MKSLKTLLEERRELDREIEAKVKATYTGKQVRWAVRRNDIYHIQVGNVLDVSRERIRVENVKTHNRIWLDISPYSEIEVIG